LRGISKTKQALPPIQRSQPFRAAARSFRLWRIEVANGFKSAIRRRRITRRYRDESLVDLRLLAIEVDNECDARVWTSTLALADRFGLSVYDSCYLELAQRRDTLLATLDARLRSAGEALGLPTTPT
jgi:predicted nucleic acid-binding protein